VESLRRLGAAAGLVLEHVEYDSTEFQFIGSELYRQDRTLAELPTAFPAARRRRFRRMAAALNRQGRGDQAAFYFRKAPAEPGARRSTTGTSADPTSS
jgi:hypothetical protein